jgi:hypothetical protein
MKATRRNDLSLQSIRKAWARLPVPPDSSRVSAAEVPGTNTWVFKGHESDFGIVLVGVARPPRTPPLQNVTFTYRDEKLVEDFSTPGKTRTIKRCLEVHLNPECSREALFALLGRLEEREPSGTYTTQGLLEVIQDMIEMLKPMSPGASKDAVIGAWGELFFLENLLRRASSIELQTSILKSWESAGVGRDILDFRFASVAVVVEVKTSTGRRTHHINGYGQVTIPEGFRRGYLASILIQESIGKRGRNCEDLIQSILHMLRGEPTEQQVFRQLLRAKLELRGRECHDTKYSFLADALSLVFYELASVPRPSPAQHTSEVEWNADLASLREVSAAEAGPLIASIAS